MEKEGEKVTQDETFKFLQKKKKWMTTREISTALGISMGSILSNLKKLMKRGEVIKKKNKMYHAGCFWKVKI